MKKPLKLIALLLVFASLAMVFAACGSEKTEAQKTDNNTGTDSGSGTNSGADVYPHQLDGVSFADDNPTIRFIVCGGDFASRSIAIDEDADPDFKVNAAVIERNLNVEQKLGVKIELTDTIEMQAMIDKMQPVLTSSMDYYDVVGAYQYFDMGLAFGEYTGKFVNYNTLEKDQNYIDVTKPYWDKETYDTLAYKGAAYWLTGDISQTWVGQLSVCYINQRIWGLMKDKVKSLTGYTDIYDVVNNGKWTMDVMSELVKAAYLDTNGNDKVDMEDQLGLASIFADINNTTVDCLAAGCRVTYSKIVDGVPQLAFNNDHNIKFSDKLVNLYRNCNAYTQAWEEGNTPLEIFARGNVLCVVNWLNEAETYLADMQEDYYVIPCPKLDENQDGYSATIGDSVNQYGVLTSTPNIAATTATLEMMAYYSYDIVTPAYYDNTLKDRYTRDAKSAEMIDLIRSSIYSDFAALWSDKIGGVTWFLRQNCDKRNLVSGFKSKEKAWTTSLNKLLQDLESSANTGA